MAQWYQAIHLTKRYRLGSIKKDITGAQFVYGAGVGSLAVGDFVVFNGGTYAPVRMVSTVTGQVAISAAANTSTTNFSWYMVYGATAQVPGLAGLVNINSTAPSVDKTALSQTAVAGRALGDAVHAGLMISGAWAVGVSASNLGNALLNYPSTAGVSLA